MGPSTFLTPDAGPALPVPGASSPAVREASCRFGWSRGFTFVEMMLIVAILGVLATLASTVYQGYRDRLKVVQASSDIIALATMIKDFNGDHGRLPLDLAEIGRDTLLDPWGHPYDYVNHQTAPPGRFRKDKSIHPINSDFDLGSMGPDGRTNAPLTAQDSRDDILRANDGAFLGKASDYDP